MVHRQLNLPPPSLRDTTMSTPTQQKALFLQAKRGDFAVGTREVPKPGPGDILVQNTAVGINALEWKIQAFGIFVENYPAILGLDAAGVVEAVGEGVTSFSKGDRVLYAGFFENDHAAYQEYTLTSADLAAKVRLGTIDLVAAEAESWEQIPDNISFDQAATVPLGIATAGNGLYHPLGPGEFIAPWSGGEGKYSGTPLVVIGGSSVVGSFGRHAFGLSRSDVIRSPYLVSPTAIQLAKLSGFSPIITTASLKNAGLLKSYGATHVLDRNLSADALRAEVTKITSGLLATVFDAVGLPDNQAAGYGLLAPEGKLLTVLPESVKETSEGRTVTQVNGLVQLPHNLEAGKALYLAISGLLESGEIKVSLGLSTLQEELMTDVHGEACQR